MYCLRELMEERSYNHDELAQEMNILVPKLNADQRRTYDLIMNTVATGQQELIFVYGHGGAGKTFLWKTVTNALRSQGKIVLAVASSWITSLLLPNGRTTHSRTLKDIMDILENLFGGKTIVLRADKLKDNTLTGSVPGQDEASRLVNNPSSNPTPSTNPNPKGRNRRRSKQRIEEFNLDELSPPIVVMADQPITADNFELKHGLLTLVQNKQFFGHDKEDPHANIRYFNKITSTLRFPNISNTSIKLMLFPFSLEGAARIWREKEPPRSIFIWDDLVSKFINQFFPPSKTTNLPNEITNFQQRFDESFSEACDKFKDLLRACPYHGFLELHQLDRFYNALNSKDQDSLNSAAGGNFLDKMPRECLAIIESKSKVCYSLNKPVVAKVSMNTSTFAYQAPAYQALAPQTQGVLKEDFSAYVKANDAVMRNMQTQGQNLQNQLTNLTKLLTKFVNTNSASTLSSGTLPSNTIAIPRSDLKAITTRSGVSYDGPQIPPLTSFLPKPVSEPVISPVSTPRPNLKYLVPYPSIMQDQKLRDKANDQREKFSQIFKDLNFNISFADALILMRKFGPSIKSLLTNKDKLCELARTLLIEVCSMVLLKKFPEKLGDPGKFLIPCDFLEMTECLALADLDASINLMPLSVWNKLFLPDLSPTCMTLELVDRLISRPFRVAEDVYVKVGTFQFQVNFVIVDFDSDPRVPLILERSFLKTERALIDVFKGELTLRVGKEAITFNLDQTSRYSANYNDMTEKRIDVIDMSCEEYSQEVLGGHTYLRSILNDDPSLPPPNQGNYMPEVRKELKICEAKSEKSSIDEPPEVELKDLPLHIEYTFLEGDDKLPLIIAKDLSMEEKTALIMVLKSHKRAIAWKLCDIKGIDPEFCTHKILIEKDFELAVQHQRRVNPKIHDVIKQEVLKLLDAGLIYPISDSLWVSPVHCVPKKGGFTVVENQMQQRLAENQYYCFLDGFSGYFQIPIDPKDQEKTTFTCPYETFAYRRMPFGLCNAPGMFQRCMMAIFHDMIEKIMEVFMDDFSLFQNSFQSRLSYLERMLKSDFAIGAVLGQRQDKYFRPIHYASKTMIKIESNYTTTEKEMLAVVYAFEKFQSYLIMNMSIMYTDHSALKYLFANKDSKARLLRWDLFLQEFTFKVIDTKGAENLAADHLS
nr:reverse transcriptase domain-containing protein [Tanacetum cinerariifolium]